jgi:hypothetical protein
MVEHGRSVGVDEYSKFHRSPPKPPGAVQSRVAVAKIRGNRGRSDSHHHLLFLWVPCNSTLSVQIRLFSSSISLHRQQRLQFRDRILFALQETFIMSSASKRSILITGCVNHDIVSRRTPKHLNQ